MGNGTNDDFDWSKDNVTVPDHNAVAVYAGDDRNVLIRQKARSADGSDIAIPIHPHYALDVVYALLKAAGLNDIQLCRPRPQGGFDTIDLRSPRPPLLVAKKASRNAKKASGNAERQRRYRQRKRNARRNAVMPEDKASGAEKEALNPRPVLRAIPSIDERSSPVPDPLELPAFLRRSKS